MAAYNFQKQFVEPIRQGVKRQTIRRSRPQGNAQVGKHLQLYNGMRTKDCVRIIPDPVCKAVRPIVVDVIQDGDYFVPSVVVDGNKLLPGEVEAFARLDGFKNANAFGKFFYSMYGASANLSLIEW